MKKVSSLQNDKSKVKGIVDELLSNSINANSRKISVEIEDLKDQIKITVVDDGHGMTMEKQEEANHILENNRKPELEEYYGELVGVENSISGFYLVSMLSDKATLTSEEGKGTKVVIYRKK